MLAQSRAESSTFLRSDHGEDALARYPDISLAEDAAFLRQAVGRGARLGRIAGDDLFL